MYRMPEKIATAGSYSVSGFLIGFGKCGHWLADLDWNKVAIILGIVIGIATYFTNVYFQRKQAQTIKENDDKRTAIMQQIAEKINPNNPPAVVKVMADIAAQTSDVMPPNSI